jgi:hypothetical protein
LQQNGKNRPKKRLTLDARIRTEINRMAKNGPKGGRKGPFAWCITFREKVEKSGLIPGKWQKSSQNRVEREGCE